MNDFIKFTDIENHYRTKTIDRNHKDNPELLVCKYINMEKIDGCNVQFIINKYEVKFAKRNSIIGGDDDLYGLKVTVQEEIYQKLIKRIQQWIGKEQTYTLLGEYFGNGIQKRCNYGEKQFKFFGLKCDNVYMSPKRFITTMTELGFDNLIVPILGIYDSFDEAQDQSEIFDSTIMGVEDNKAEGFVTWPYDIEAHKFLIKKKNESFEKDGKIKRKKQPRQDIPKHVSDVIDLYNGYLTENRLLDMFSKEGEIKSPSEMGEYIKLMMSDAKSDFLKDHMDEFNTLGNKEKSTVFKSTGSIVVELLKKYL